MHGSEVLFTTKAIGTEEGTLRLKLKVILDEESVAEVDATCPCGAHVKADSFTQLRWWAARHLRAWGTDAHARQVEGRQAIARRARKMAAA